jgi:DNA-binding response OmpR family regulator
MKIVMLTARGRDVERDKGLKSGANAYVTKPFSTKELMITVRDLLPGSG